MHGRDERATAVDLQQTHALCISAPNTAAPSQRHCLGSSRRHSGATHFGFVDERETGESEVSAEAIVVAETRREGVPLEQRDSVGGQQFKRCPTFLSHASPRQRNTRGEWLCGGLTSKVIRSVTTTEWFKSDANSCISGSPESEMVIAAS